MGVGAQSGGNSAQKVYAQERPQRAWLLPFGLKWSRLSLGGNASQSNRQIICSIFHTHFAMDGLLLTEESQRFFDSVGIKSLLTLGNLDAADLEEMLDSEKVMAGAHRKDVMAVHAKAVAKCDSQEQSIRAGRSSWSHKEEARLAASTPAIRPKGSKTATAVPSSNRGKSGLPLASTTAFLSGASKTATSSCPAITEADDIRTSASRAKHLDELWVIYCAIGPQGNCWHENKMSSDAGRRTVKQVLQEEWNETEVLGTHIATYGLWKGYAVRNDVDPADPDELDLRLFLKSFQEKGATVPLQRFNSLVWLQMHIGLKCFSDIKKIRRMVQPPATHAEKQAKPITAKIWNALSKALRDTNIFVVTVAFFATLLVHSVLRPKHLWATSFRLTPNRIEGFVTKGKTRKNGLRQPFWWSCSRLAFDSMDLGKVLDQVTQALPDSDPFTILPELWPRRSNLDTATGFGPKPMSRSRLLKFLVQVLRKYGISEAELEEIEGLYSLRRVLTTLSEIAGYQPHERLDVWGLE